MQLDIERVEILLLIAAVVAMITRRLHVPYGVGLVITGTVLALTAVGPNVQMSKDLIFSALLPPLIFEAALLLPWKELRPALPVVVSMATIGVALAASVTALGMHYLVGWPWISAAVFGGLISATDPVSVIATFKEAGVKGRLRTLAEAESLFNDGTAAVLFGVLVGVAGGVAITPVGVLLQILFTVGGGMVCGAVVAIVVIYLVRKTTDHLVEITFTTVAAYGSFLLAEHFHFSGVLAVLVAGLIVGGSGPLGALSEKGREAVEAFWGYAAFVANSLIFLLIGIREGQQKFSHVWTVLFATVVIVTLGRAVAVYPVAALFSRSALKVSSKHQHALFWGGLRGALALALALGLPDSMPYREQVVTVTFAVVAFSVIVQGLTITPLLKRLGELRVR
jgi:Na+:H+ antiporter